MKKTEPTKNLPDNEPVLTKTTQRHDQPNEHDFNVSAKPSTEVQMLEEQHQLAKEKENPTQSVTMEIKEPDQLENGFICKESRNETIEELCQPEIVSMIQEESQCPSKQSEEQFENFDVVPDETADLSINLPSLQSTQREPTSVSNGSTPEPVETRELKQPVVSNQFNNLENLPIDDSLDFDKTAQRENELEPEEPSSKSCDEPGQPGQPEIIQKVLETEHVEMENQLDKSFDFPSETDNQMPEEPVTTTSEATPFEQTVQRASASDMIGPINDNDNQIPESKLQELVQPVTQPDLFNKLNDPPPQEKPTSLVSNYEIENPGEAVNNASIPNEPIEQQASIPTVMESPISISDKIPESKLQELVQSVTHPGLFNKPENSLRESSMKVEVGYISKESSIESIEDSHQPEIIQKALEEPESSSMPVKALSEQLALVPQKNLQKQSAAVFETVQTELEIPEIPAQRPLLSGLPSNSTTNQNVPATAIRNQIVNPKVNFLEAITDQNWDQVRAHVVSGGRLEDKLTDGRRLLQVMVDNNQLELFDLILKRGLMPVPEDLNVTNSHFHSKIRDHQEKTLKSFWLEFCKNRHIDISDTLELKTFPSSTDRNPNKQFKCNFNIRTLEGENYGFVVMKMKPCGDKFVTTTENVPNVFIDFNDEDCPTKKIPHRNGELVLCEIPKIIEGANQMELFFTDKSDSFIAVQLVSYTMREGSEEPAPKRVKLSED